jgi:uncharacterized PurR-regulated membrane protein YhhQ (DUF165 family)
MTTSSDRGRIALGLYVLTIIVANWLTHRYGPVPVGFGLYAPAGVYAVGLAFTLRDVVQRTLGRTWAVVAILAGAAVSAVVSPELALASGCAFLLSETLDFLVYSQLESQWLVAVVASNAVGLVLDSILFLWLAFGSLELLKGQIVGKAWMTLLAVLVLAVINRRRQYA